MLMNEDRQNIIHITQANLYSFYYAKEQGKRDKEKLVWQHKYVQRISTLIFIITYRLHIIE